MRVCVSIWSSERVSLWSSWCVYVRKSSLESLHDSHLQVTVTSVDCRSLQWIAKQHQQTERTRDKVKVSYDPAEDASLAERCVSVSIPARLLDQTTTAEIWEAKRKDEAVPESGPFGLARVCVCVWCWGRKKAQCH